MLNLHLDPGSGARELLRPAGRLWSVRIVRPGSGREGGYPMLRTRWGIAGAVLLALALGACGAVPLGQTALHTVSVTGTATTRLAPDIVVMTLGVQTQGRDVAEVVSENNRRSAEVLGVFRSAGVASEDVQTTRSEERRGG